MNTTVDVTYYFTCCDCGDALEVDSKFFDDTFRVKPCKKCMKVPYYKNTLDEVYFSLNKLTTKLKENG